MEARFTITGAHCKENLLYYEALTYLPNGDEIYILNSFVIAFLLTNFCNMLHFLLYQIFRPEIAFD